MTVELFVRGKTEEEKVDKEGNSDKENIDAMNCVEIA